MSRQRVARTYRHEELHLSNCEHQAHTLFWLDLPAIVFLVSRSACSVSGEGICEVFCVA